MSILECPDLQIWNNAAFDNGESEDSITGIKSSWSNFQPILTNLSESIESDSSKENQSPGNDKSSVSVNSPLPIKPLQPSSAIEVLKAKKNEIKPKQTPEKPFSVLLKNGNEEEIRDEGKIDLEIEEIEMEIGRLSLKLEALRLEKAEKNAKMVERRGKIVAAKFLEQKQSEKNVNSLKRMEDPLFFHSMRKVQRRGVSMGPSEIVVGAGIRYRKSEKPEITPVHPLQSRRKSCFWKLEDIDEGKVTKERGGGNGIRTLSLSPKSRKTGSKVQVFPKQAATTVGSKKSLKKEDCFISSIQPKKLFKDVEKPLPLKKPLKQGRVVPSRYNQGTANQTNGNSAMRKRSLPENEEDGKRTEKKRASLVGKSRGNESELCEQSRVKKKWEIPSEVVVYKGVEEDESAPSITNVADDLPKIRTIRCVNETPRDSGAAKRVAELVGRKSYFGTDEAVEKSVCQALSFADDFEAK